MLQRFFDYIFDVTVRQSVKNVFAGVSVNNEIRASKNFELMRNGGFRHTQKLRNITYAHRLAVKSEKDAHSCRITEYLKEIRQIVYLVKSGHLQPLFINKLSVRLVAFT